MDIDSNEIKQNSNIVEVIYKHLTLTKHGSEYYGICPFHDDKKSSLQVNESKQVFKCFACGVGGDSIEFLIKMGRNYIEACNEIKGISTLTETNPVQNKAKKPIKKQEWEFISVPPQEKPDLTHYKFGKPSGDWVYHDKNGIKICYIARFNLPNGEKQVIPMVYARKNNFEQWRWQGIPSKRPLYNLHLIVKNPKATILLVEGEKTADAAQKMLNHEKTVVTCWIGGANGIKQTDFTSINGRKIIFWADNDAPGFLAMNNISDLINSDVKRFVKIPNSYTPKWDAADKQWKPNEINKFIKDNLTTEKYPVLLEASKPMESIKNPPLPPAPKKTVLKLSQNEHFKILGYDKDENSKLVYFFFSFEAKTVVKLSPTSMNKSNLMMLAPLNYWEHEFGGSGSTKVNTDMAQQFLIGQSHKMGQFKDKLIRGRGIWLDNDSFIVHTGTKLIADNTKYDLSEYQSKYVYEIGESLSYGIGTGLSTTESAKLIDKMKWLLWERNINAYLLAGWCVIAPFCGALNWRPHIWLTGPSGSGKSWVMSILLRKVLGDIPVVVQGKTTEAGVRGLLQSDARPLLFDESDVDDENDKIRIQSILALARSSSGNNTGVVGKGTQTGGSRSYEMRSCFAFSSIGVALNQRADHTRFTVLSLRAFENERTKEQFAEYELSLNELVNEDYSRDLQARTLSIFDVVLENSKTFADAASHLIGNRRVGDQIGAMLAGAFSLTSKHKITYDKAIDWLKDKDLTEEKSLSQTKDELQLFSLILGHSISVEGEFRNMTRTIGELILIESNYILESHITPDTAKNRLRREGIMIWEGKIVFSNTSPAIKRIIRGTSWGSNHANVLLRIEKAEKIPPKTFYPGLNSRGVGVPLEMITEDYTVSKTETEKETEDIFNTESQSELY